MRGVKREDALREAAALHLRAGDMAAYCDAMASVGEWDLATAVAPAVSLDFWAALVQRRAAAAAATGASGGCNLLLVLMRHGGCRPARSWTLFSFEWRGKAGSRQESAGSACKLSSLCFLCSVLLVQRPQGTCMSGLQIAPVIGCCCSSCRRRCM